MTEVPERHLFRAVVAQVVADATATVSLVPPRRRRVENLRDYLERYKEHLAEMRQVIDDRKAARGWLLEPDPDLFKVCEFADVDPSAVPEWDQVLCYESTTLSDLPDLTTGAPIKGVQLVQLSARLATYEGDVAWRRVEGARTPSMMRAQAAFMRRFQGRPYEENQLELLRSALDGVTLRQNQPDASSVFCSEMAMLLHRAVGVMAPPGEPANEFTPADYGAGALSLSAAYGLGPTVAVTA